MRYVLILLVALSLLGCKEKSAGPFYQFKAGDIVRCKIGGPVGMVTGVSQELGPDGRECDYVRFYADPKGINIGVGGSGLISGGDGIKSNGSYYEVEFHSFELEKAKQ